MCFKSAMILINFEMLGWMTTPSPYTIFFFVLVSYFLVTGNQVFFVEREGGFSGFGDLNRQTYLKDPVKYWEGDGIGQ